MCRENGARILTARQGPSSEGIWKRAGGSGRVFPRERQAAGNEEVDMKHEKGKREKTRKENESGKEGDIARGARMARRGRGASTHFHHLYTRRGYRRWRRLSRRYFGFPYSGVSALFHQSSPFLARPPAYYPWRNGSTGSRRCTFGQGLITVEGSPPYLLLTRKDPVFISRSARCRHCRDYSAPPFRRFR